MSTWCVIVNPAAGRGTAGRQQAVLEQALREAAVSYELLTTHAPGGATELTCQAIERGYQRVVAVGGDGSISEVVNGIIACRQQEGTATTLGIVALGTGNDFIKSLPGFRPNDIAGAVQRLAAGKTRTIDVGEVRITNPVQTHTTWFINDMGLGIHALIAAESRKIKRFKGIMVYAIAVARALITYKAAPMNIEYDTHTLTRPFLLACVANGRCQGAGFWLTPRAVLDDGMLDLCMIDMAPRLEILRRMPQVLKGAHEGIRQVTLERARHTVITSKSPFLVSTDGEIVATDARRVDARVVPHALDLCV